MTLEWFRRMFRRGRPRAIDAELEDWRIVEAINKVKGEAAVFRIRIRRPSLVNIDEFQIAVRVFWPYVSDSVMPTDDVREQHNTFDVALDELTGENGHSELVRVATGNGLKEWLFYTTDVQQFGETFNRLLVGHPIYPISLEFEQDRDWTIWSDFVASIGEKTEL